ncbi:DsbA family protein [Marinobacter sp.]|uniref:DsbA family protein n=1 Tax=Marinobacter sp. TaxID=50741 RepID=UPI0025B94D2B|nr:DsbA family protein [Marinobacter sp.]
MTTPIGGVFKATGNTSPVTIPAKWEWIKAEFQRDADEVMEAMAQPEIKTALIEAMDEAVSRGVFGAPTFFVKDEMHFGQDRLDWALR